MNERAARDQESFLGEAWESLAAAEDALARWQAGAAERGRAELEMVCHRLTGTAALYGWTALSALAERLERLVRRRLATKLEGTILALLDEAMAVLPAVLERIAGDGSEALPEVELLACRLDRELESGSEPAGEADGEGEPTVDEGLRRFRREQPLLVEPFTLEAEELWDDLAEALQRLGRAPADVGPLDEGPLDDLFRRTHTLKGAAYMVGCRPVGDLAHRAEELLAGYHRQRQPLPRPALAALGKTSLALRAMLDVLAGAEISAVASYRNASEALAAAPTLADEPGGDPPDGGPPSGDAAAASGPPPALAGEPDAAGAKLIRVERSRLDTLLDMMGDLLAARDGVERRLGHLETLAEQLDASRRRMADAVARFGEKYLDPAPPDPPASVPAAAFEELGELELDRYDDFNVLSRHVAEVADDVASVQRDFAAAVSDLKAGSAQLQKLIRRARGELGRTRLAPVGPLFARLGRLVATVAEEEKKLVDVELAGEDVQADGALIDRLAEPLLHLLQNAVIHGLETPLSRLEAGKPARGRIGLRAAAHGSALRLEVEDDGAGVDLARLRELAVERRFATRDQVAALDDRGALELVFLPGLSTLGEVTRRAGRGVGMDVVRDALARLEGDVEASTEPGRGTCFTLTLPATLLLSEALIVRAGEERYALALPAVKRIVALGPGELAAANGSVVVGESERPIRHLAQILGQPPPCRPPAETPVLLLGAGGRRLALAVDQVEGIAEVTVRPFDELLSGATLFAGGISMPDGGLVLVLDSAALLALPEPGGEAVRAEAVASAVAPAAARTRILVVDDSLSVRKVLCRTLGNAGFDVAAAADGLEALQALRDRTFDAVVTDLEMPRFNGYELIEDLRRRFPPERLPIVVITTRASHRHAERARSLGASDYFYKPIDGERLVARLREETGHLP